MTREKTKSGDTMQFSILLNLMLFIGTFLSATLAAENIELNKEDELNSLIKHIDDIRQKHNVPAVGLVVIKQGKLEWQGSLGVVDIESKKIADENTIYRVGSITKAFTALGLLKLQEQGKLKLNDNLVDYVSSDYFQNPWEDESPVTIEQLLEHTAGFTDIGTAEFAHQDPRSISLQDGLSFNRQHHLVQWEPGLHSSYSNLDIGLAGAVIEKISGVSYDDFLKNEVLIPLNMNNSSTLLTPQVATNLAKGYDSSGEGEIEYWHLLLRPFGALNSSPKEMANFLQMLINRGRFNNLPYLTNASIKRMEKPDTTLAAKAGLLFGYGLANYSSEHGGFIFHGHGGTASGYKARFDYLLENKSGYVVMTSSNNSAAINAIYTALRDYLVSDLEIKKPPESQPLVDDITDYLGYYQSITSRSRVAKFLTRFIDISELTLNGDRLQLSSLFRGNSTLIHQGNNIFRESETSIANNALIKTASGDIYLQNDRNYQRISTLSFYTQVSLLMLTLILIVVSLFYFIMLLFKQIYVRKLPNMQQRYRLLILTPYMIFTSLIIILIFFSPNKDTFAATLFTILSYSILIISAITFLITTASIIRTKPNIIMSILAFLIPANNAMMAIYLYNMDLLSQPIWS